MISRNELIKSLELMSLITQTPLSIINSAGETLYCTITEEHHYIPVAIAKAVIAAYMERNITEHTPYIHLFSLKILQGVIEISDGTYIFVGPVCITQFSIENSTEAFSSIISNDELAHFHNLLSQFVPLDFFRFAGILAQISNNCNDTSFTPSEIVNNNFSRKIDIEPINTTKIVNQESFSISSINFFQHELFSIISTGNMDALIKHWQNLVIKSFINLDISREDTYFYCIPFYAFMFQGALKGGADINLCFEKYTNQVVRFKQAKNIIECITELKRSSYEYCKLVNESKKKDYMPEICKKCVEYINDHIQEKITVDDLTHLCGIHRNKLYDIFHSHFDMTISEYIEGERLRRAMVYLRSTNYTISEIASTLGYANQSHFTQIFKKHFGCTPGQYQKDLSVTDHKTKNK